MTYGQWPRQDGQQGNGAEPGSAAGLVPPQRRYGQAGPVPGQYQPRQAPPQQQPGPQETGPQECGPPAPRPPYLLPRSPRRKSWLARHKGPAGLFAFVALVAVIAAASSGGSASSSRLAAGTRHVAAAPVAAAIPQAAHAAAAARTVTYEVTGSAADVTYGAAGRTLRGTVPMRVTAKLGAPGYYSVRARLAGGGSVTVKILVDGQAASQGSATGGDNVATAEISQGPLSGQ